MSTLTEEISDGKTITKIAHNQNVSRDEIYRQLKSSGLNHQRLKFNHDFFENIDCEEKAYWLGFVMADGCVSMTQSPKIVIGLHRRDRKHLEKWHRSLKSCIKIHYCREVVASTHYSAKMCQDLINIGCVPRKSLCLRFPVLRADLIRHFIRGYFDGDGSISANNPNKGVNNPQLRAIFVGTKAFLEILKNWLQCSPNVRPKGNNNKAYQLEIHGNKSAMTILDLMYRDATVFLDRKWEIYHSYL